MRGVAKEGRTVLFVSHNMAAVRTLCSRAIFMEQGQMVTDADAETSISSYLSEDNISDAKVEWEEHSAPQTPEIRFTKGYILNDVGECSASLDYRKDFRIRVEYQVLKPIENLRIGFFCKHRGRADVRFQ